MSRLIACFALLVAPAHVFYQAPATRLPPRAAVARSAAARPLVALRSRPLIAMAIEEEYYRTLGVGEDANYDEITSRYDELEATYGGDAAMMAKIDEAKDKVMDAILRKRMEGSLQATYEGRTAREDIKAPPVPGILEIANGYRKKMFQRPSPKHALQVVGLLGGLSLAGWIAPNTAQVGVCMQKAGSGVPDAVIITAHAVMRPLPRSLASLLHSIAPAGCTPPGPDRDADLPASLASLSLPQTTLLINTVSAMGFMYNRGEADVVRDDYGQIGEIRPMKKKPMAFTAAITSIFWFWGFFKVWPYGSRVIWIPRQSHSLRP